MYDHNLVNHTLVWRGFCRRLKEEQQQVSQGRHKKNGRMDLQAKDMTKQRPGEVARGEGYNWHAMGAFIILTAAGFLHSAQSCRASSLAFFLLFAKSVTEQQDPYFILPGNDVAVFKKYDKR